jgi:protein tyrosine phosphatase (PTP) superfamily phosphohydrolase (DUF442 family)
VLEAAIKETSAAALRLAASGRELSVVAMNPPVRPSSLPASGRGVLVSDHDASTPEARRRLYWESTYRHWSLWREFYGNVHRVADGVYRSGQLTPPQLRRMFARHGIRTVINLRGPVRKCRLLALEVHLCAEQGVELIHFGLDSRGVPRPEAVRAAHDLLSAAKGPLLIHCKSGADRAGLMSALVLHWRQGMPLERAARQLRFWPFLHFKLGRTGLIDHYFVQARDYLRAHPEHDLLYWTENVMNRDALEASFSSRVVFDLLVDRLLRRE